MSKSQLGKHWKIKDTSKMSKARMGNKNRKGIIPWNKGKTGFEGFWKGKKRLNTSGERNWNWQGGTTLENDKIRHSIEYRLWREAVFARDNWTCQKCEERGIELHPHHIQNFADYPELRFAIDNGITLSEKAHKEFHKIY